MRLKPIIAEQRRYDGRLVRRWPALRVPDEAAPIRLVVPYGTSFETATGTWEPATAAIYRYWPDRWHDVITVVGPDRSVLGLYCNILQPPSWHGDLLAGIDLDLDVWVNPDGTYRIMDTEEFEEHVIALRYPPELASRARGALQSLTDQITTRTGLFATSELLMVDPVLAPYLGEPVVRA